jgi:FG-GAP-like repeat
MRCEGRPRTQTGVTAVIGAIIVVACGGTLKTGANKKPANKPADDGTCPAGLDLCGTGRFAVCQALQTDPQHCGDCERECTAGIACVAGVCQQTVCTGSVPLSGQATTFNSAVDVANEGSAILADVNGDGLLDLVDWKFYGPLGVTSGVFHVSLGQPGGGFGAAESYTTGNQVQTIETVDLNDDGAADLFVREWVGPTCDELWLGHADGHLTRDSVPMDNDCVSTITVADVTGDGHPDLLTASESYRPLSLKVYSSDSTGALHLTGTYVLSSQDQGGTDMIYHVQILARDWNGDGAPDIVVLSNFLQLLYNHGDGTFADPVDCGIDIADANGVGNGTDAVLWDFNHDGRFDLAINLGGAIGVMLGLGECRFAPMVNYDLPGGSGPLRAADINGDGQLDLISLVSNDQLGILLGNPDGTFQAQEPWIDVGSGAIEDVIVAEVSGDQRPDVVLVGREGQITTWENTCP